MESNYHRGEIAARIKAGETEIGERNVRIIKNSLNPGAIYFIEHQPFFLASSNSKTGTLAISVISGSSGYIKVINESTVIISRSLLYSNPYDVFWVNIVARNKIGLLFIDPATRRRFRINGSSYVTAENVIISVDQAYPNCPKYIQQRHIFQKAKPVYSNIRIAGNSLIPLLMEIIKKADTFFVGSCDRYGNMDASHRGGKAGFVHIEDDLTLWIPDYTGNSMYNTLGNFISNPNAALLFLDFENNKHLQISGTAEIIWNDTREIVNTGGTNRYWIFKIKEWEVADNLKGFEWTFIDYSPFNPSSIGKKYL